MSTHLEMVYTRYEASCRDPHIDPAGVLRECRRHAHHTGAHSSDHPYLEWESET